MGELPSKVLAARESLWRRFHRGFAEDRECLVLLDVLRLISEADPTEALKDLDFLHSDKKHRVERKTPEEFLPYRYAHWFTGIGSIARLCLDSERQAPWLPLYRTTIYANDLTGLQPTQILPTFEVMPPSCFAMLELAVDFRIRPVMPEFVRRHCVFGKSQRDLSITNAAVDWWGARRSRKRTRSYTKYEVAAHRVEFRLGRAFLDAHGIRDIFDFRRLADIIAKRHIFFGELDEDRLAHQLRKNLGRTNHRTQAILRRIHELQHDLCAVLRYLRRDVGLTNVRRLLVPLPENDLARHGLQDWGAIWPKAPQKLKS